MVKTLDTLWMDIEEAIRKANQDRESQALAGDFGDGDGNPWDPYQGLEDLLEASLTRIRFLRTHQHEWNEDDRCTHCGADGRA